MAKCYRLQIDGVHGWKRVARARDGHTYIRPDELAWQQKIRDAWEAEGSPRFMGEVTVYVVAYMDKATKTPDADNIMKSVLDALNGYAWTDDKFVTDQHSQKVTRNINDSNRDITLIQLYGEVIDDAEHL